MEKFNDENMIREIRNLTSRLNYLRDHVRIVNEQLETRSSSEKEFYAFLGALVDKLIHYQESKNANKT